MAIYVLKHAHDCAPHCHAAPGWLGPLVLVGIAVEFVLTMYAFGLIGKQDEMR